jgi:hypothetical protein
MMSDVEAEAIVRELRRRGVRLWLAQGEHDSVRLRAMFVKWWFLPRPRLLRELERRAEHSDTAYLRALAQAVDRLGADDPPPDNPYGDRALRGGHWNWNP